MSKNTKIQWCDSTINFWEGCSKISPGCSNCYAEARDKHYHGGAHWGPGAPRRKSKSAVKDALRLNKKPWVHGCGVAMSEEDAKACGYMCASDAHDGYPKPLHRRLIFSLSLGDWLEGPPVKVVDGVPYGGIPVEWRAEMLETVWRCSGVEFILCSKRIEDWLERMEEVLSFWREPQEPSCGAEDWLASWLKGNPPNNVTLLASVEDQEQANARIPALLRIPASRRGLSLEPLLGPVDLERAGAIENDGAGGERGGQSINFKRGLIDWLIIGGESGPKARPCNVEWIRSLVQQGKAAGVPMFVKQMGANAWADVAIKSDHPSLAGMVGVENRMLQLCDRKGGDPSEWPMDLRVQEFPFDTSRVGS